MHRRLISAAAAMFVLAMLSLNILFIVSELSIFNHQQTSSPATVT